MFDLVTHGGGEVILESTKVALFEKLIEVKKVLSKQYLVKRRKSFGKFLAENLTLYDPTIPQLGCGKTPQVWKISTSEKNQNPNSGVSGHFLISA